jgi:hypothetical protein
MGLPTITASNPTSLPKKNGGARRDRTDDLMLAKHALSQLSYGPFFGKKKIRAIRRGAQSGLRPQGVGVASWQRHRHRSNGSKIRKADGRRR